MTELTMSEAAFQASVIELAEALGWSVFHPPDNMRRKNKNDEWYVQDVKVGYPDLTMLRPPEILVAELKSDTGKLRPGQQEWLDRFAACGVEAYLWRPRDFDAVHERLKRRTAPDPSHNEEG